jgi:hypothetical protein
MHSSAYDTRKRRTMPLIPEDKLEKVMKDAGLGVLSRRKLAKANKAADEQPVATVKPRGHGAPREQRPALGEL